MTVFELSDRWPELAAKALIVSALVAGSALAVSAVRRQPAEFRLAFWVAATVPLVLAAFMGIPALLTFADLVRLEREVQAGHARVVSGPIDEFVPRRRAAKVWESFSVNGVRFTYAESLITAGFNRTVEDGGPLTGDEVVRVTFVGDTIVELAILD